MRQRSTARADTYLRVGEIWLNIAIVAPSRATCLSLDPRGESLDEDTREDYTRGISRMISEIFAKEAAHPLNNSDGGWRLSIIFDLLGI